MSISEPRVEVADSVGNALIQGYKPWALAHKDIANYLLSGQKNETGDRAINARAEEEVMRLHGCGATKKDLDRVVAYLDGVLDESAENGTDHGRLCQALGGYLITAILNLSCAAGRLEAVLGKEGKPYHSIGYRLREPRTIIALPGSHIDEYATEIENGATVVNRGSAKFMGKRGRQGSLKINAYGGKVEVIESWGGTDINLGEVEYMTGGSFQLNGGIVTKVFGYELEHRRIGTLRANLKKVREQAKSLRGICSSSIEINTGDADTTGEDSSDITFLNLARGRIGEAFTNNPGMTFINQNKIAVAKGALYFDFGKVRDGKHIDLKKSGPLNYFQRGRQDNRIGTIKHRCGQIEEELLQIEQVLAAPLEKVLKYDWTGTERDIRKAVLDIMLEASRALKDQ